MTNRITPTVYSEYNEEENGYDVEIELPGASKDGIDLKVLPGGFMVRAPRSDTDDTEYVGSFAFCCPVNEEKVTAEFDNGLLKAHFKMAEPYEKATNVAIE
jgi:HSP20 family molecular chaperone IbpA